MGGDALGVELAGLKLRNPVMLAAGILGVTGLSLRRVAEAGAGATAPPSQPNPSVGVDRELVTYIMFYVQVDSLIKSFTIIATLAINLILL